MRRPLRIALFADGAPYLINILMGLRKAFQALGVEVHAGWPLPNGRLLDAFAANFKPDAVLEINRSRGQIIDCDQRFIHICWQHDFQIFGQRLLNDLGGSDLFYLMLPPDVYGIAPADIGEWRYLWPAVDPEVFCPGPTPVRWDLSLVGHMYPPLDEQLNGATVTAGGRDAGAFGELAAAFFRAPIDTSNYSIPRVHDFLVRYFADRGAVFDPGAANPKALVLAEELLMRIKSRSATAAAMLNVSSRVRFFGNAGWGAWPAFARYYGGEILDPAYMADVYRATVLNVHDVRVLMHFRTLEGMAAGGGMMIHDVDHPEMNRQFARWFTPDEHYIPWRPDNFADTARRALANPDGLRRMGEAAAAAVHAAHTWDHRARQILADLDVSP